MLLKRIGVGLALICCILFSCDRKSDDGLKIDNVHYYDWQGDTNSKKILAKVFDFLGGRKKWADLKSVYVHYTQQDNNLGSYPSRQWQSLDSLKIILDQKINNRRFVRILNDSIGWVITENMVGPLDERNTDFLKYWYQLDYYKKIHELAVGKDLKVRFTDQFQIIVLKNNKYFCGFEVDQNLNPEIYHRPKFNSQNISLRLLEWKDKDGFKYPYKGKAMEQDFKFTVEEIEFSFKPSSEAFNISFNSNYDTTAIYNH